MALRLWSRGIWGQVHFGAVLTHITSIDLNVLLGKERIQSVSIANVLGYSPRNNK